MTKTAHAQERKTKRIQAGFGQVLGIWKSYEVLCFVKNTLVYQSTPPLHRLKLPIPRLRRQDTECQAEG